MAISLDYSFMAQAYSNDLPHLKTIMKEALAHKGFSLVNILQPCVVFNKINTYEWYR